MLMKKMFKSFLMAALVLTAGAFVACEDPNTGENDVFEGMPEISAVADVDGLTLEGGVVTVTVTSNAPWTAEVDAADVTLSKKSGNGDAVVTVTVPAATAARDIKVSFTAKGVMAGIELTADAEVALFQNAAGKLGISGITPEVVGAGAEFSLENVLVVATGTQAYVIADESGAILVYNSNHGRTVGEKINISGQVTVYTSASGSVYSPQFGTDAVVEVVSTGNEVSHNPAVVSGAEFDALLNVPVMKEVEFSATWVVSGSYVNLEVPGATNQGSIKYVDNSQYSSLSGMPVIVKGYTGGFSKSGSTYYVNVMPYSVELDPNAAWLKVDKTDLVYEASHNSNNRQTFTATYSTVEGYNFNWSIDNETDFTLGKQMASNGRTVLYVYPKAANTGATKTATVTLTYSNGTDTLTKTVNVTQKGANEAIAEFDFLTVYKDLARGDEVGTKTVDGITLAWDKGGNSNAAKWYEDCVRAYATNTFKLSGATITKVDVTYIEYTDPNTVSANVGTYTDGVPTGVWTGSANEVVFTIDKQDPNGTSTKGQRRIKKIVVTYQK